MNKTILASRNSFAKIVAVCAAIGLLCSTGATLSKAQSTSASASALSPDLQQVVTLSRQQISDDIITNYIKTSGKTYKLSADDIINLKEQGVSQTVITVLIQTSVPGGTSMASQTSPAPQNPASAISQSPAPPPVDATSSTVPTAPSIVPASSAPVVSSPPVFVPQAAPPGVSGLQDNFFADLHLDPNVWDTQSSLLASLASLNGPQVFPAIVFSLSGMQMSGIRREGQFMGINSRESFAAPFSFSTTVSGLEQKGIPFEVYLVSSDLRQWVSVAGHLGGRGGPRAGLAIGGGTPFFHGDVRIPLGGDSPEYGVWLNYTGSGLPISSLGTKFSERPLAGVPYTIQVSVGAGGLASVSLLDAAGVRIATRDVPVGPGPFHVVLASRNGPARANWLSAQVIPASPAIVAQPVVPATPTMDYFQSQLRPYGNWMDVPGYGLCWQPSVEYGWRPYYDGGHWEYTDAGYYWQSDYPWGDIAFHYGRWAYTTTGWVWVPGYEYAPSWVVWRHADEDGYIGWAPLPPGAVFVNGGWEFNHVRVGVDFAFGLGDGFFTFVDYGHLFFDPHVYHHGYRDLAVPRERLAVIYRHSVIENRYHVDHGRFVNDGLARDRMAALTHHEIRDVKNEHDLKAQDEQRNARTRMDNMHNSKPANADKGRVASFSKGENHENGGHEADKKNEGGR